jgi:hypothetical protein
MLSPGHKVRKSVKIRRTWNNQDKSREYNAYRDSVRLSGKDAEESVQA